MRGDRRFIRSVRHHEMQNVPAAIARMAQTAPGCWAGLGGGGETMSSKRFMGALKAPARARYEHRGSGKKRKTFQTGSCGSLRGWEWRAFGEFRPEGLHLVLHLRELAIEDAFFLLLGGVFDTPPN